MSSKKSPHARSSICESNKKKGNLDINLRDMGKKYAHLTITERRRIEKVGEPEGMRQKQSALTLVTSFCYCFSLCQCVCVSAFLRLYVKAAVKNQRKRQR